MTKQQEESFERVIDMLHSCEGLMQQLHEDIESLKQKPHMVGRFDMNNDTYHQFNAAWNQCCGNMARAANNLHFLRRDFEPETKHLAHWMEVLKNNPLIK
ncbi:hypothetical protein [Adhaeribacter radiodurans]|uniref:Uncharacterized protein n=1 Tax=Adhaeribacter radiodurans TaxID=2745197 RepID=A0A7L7LBC5_9BACT|nr:hypothetical protein [Adhaeribacter radiodurans]QMU30148.1 hypothetical protein HUW48_19880 [Adhaeribacter radiodurans]